jgi:hypothetical protein
MVHAILEIRAGGPFPAGRRIPTVACGMTEPRPAGLKNRLTARQRRHSVGTAGARAPATATGGPVEPDRHRLDPTLGRAEPVEPEGEIDPYDRPRGRRAAPKLAARIRVPA